MKEDSSEEPSVPLLIGTAGWALPRDQAEQFPGEGTHLQRYARVFDAVEINSSFHRSHRDSTYARWRESVPEGFRFSVKMSKEITHASRLREIEGLLDRFLGGVRHLGSTLGCILVQLPPSLAFDADVARSFFRALRDRYGGGVTCEPRHESWLLPEADALLTEHRVARVAADPNRPPGAGEPGGWAGLRYYRMHGSPKMYYSSYPLEDLTRLSEQLARARASGSIVWCIFDNTTLGAAMGNAVELLRLTSSR